MPEQNEIATADELETLRRRHNARKLAIEQEAQQSEPAQEFETLDVVSELDFECT